MDHTEPGDLCDYTGYSPVKGSLAPRIFRKVRGSGSGVTWSGKIPKLCWRTCPVEICALLSAETIACPQVTQAVYAGNGRWICHHWYVSKLGGAVPTARMDSGGLLLFCMTSFHLKVWTRCIWLVEPRSWLALWPQVRLVRKYPSLLASAEGDHRERGSLNIGSGLRC